MKNVITSRLSGFTLIELLVVVLIIGILAAIAVPQYQKTVEKARVAEAKSVLKTIAQAQDTYILSSPDGMATGDFAELDITVPTSPIWDYYLEETLGANSYALAAGRHGQDYGIYYFRGYGPEDGNFYCSPYDDEEKACEIFGGTLFHQESTGWPLVKI